MGTKLKVGDTIRVFEVTENHGYIYSSIEGRWTLEDYRSGYFGNEFGVDTFISTEVCKNLHLGIDEERRGARLVGQMRIKSLKNG